jgi:hypothetical protein
MLVACIILLFIQAMLDLTLPDLLSRIVNTGVQQAGVETAVMAAMREETMERLTLFMSELPTPWSILVPLITTRISKAIPSWLKNPSTFSRT